MRVLVDTCVISEIAKKKASKRVRDRVAGLKSAETFLSVITIGEITNGIQRLAASRKKGTLEAFLSNLERHFESRVLGINAETARIWGEVTAKAANRGKVIPATDGLIAATALQHGLHVMTRNTRDFSETGALLVDPWQGA